MDLVKVGDIEAAQDLDFQHKEWRVQRIAWVIMLLLVLAAAAGAFGRGPLARAERTAADGSFSLQYNRLVRHFSAEKLAFTIQRPVNDTIGIVFDAAYIQGIDIKQIIPEPIGTSTQNRRVTYYFEVGPDARILFDYEPDTPGKRASTIGIEQGATVRIKQFVFP